MPPTPHPPPPTRGRSGRPWDRLQEQVFAEETHCALCGKWVDQMLDPNHKMGRTVDHRVELWQGGDPLDRDNCQLAHRRCNVIKSARLRNRKTRRATLTVDAASV